MAEFNGHLSLLAAARAHGRTVLAEQSFRAPFHISKPYWNAEAKVLHVQVVNPTAGILAGDRLELAIGVEPGAALLVTTPSASRLFKMQGGAAECRQAFTVKRGGWLEVLPEPVVPHRGTRYRQITTIDVERASGMFFVDQLTPGRVAHGETWAWEQLSLEIAVRFDGELILRERLAQSGAELRTLATLAGSGDAACFANAILIAPEDNSAWRAEVAALHGNGLWAGVSALRNGGWSLKLIGRDALLLRQALRDVRRILGTYFPRLGCELRKV